MCWAVWLIKAIVSTFVAADVAADVAVSPSGMCMRTSFCCFSSMLNFIG